MTTLVWDEVGQHFFETGVSKGVFYNADGYGVAWNGLTAVEESVDTEVQPVHFDGVKINDIAIVGDFSAVMRAWTYPDEFLPYEGILEDQDGFFITEQPPDRFGLSYQTIIGNDVDGQQHGYKIHVLYNLTAVPSQKAYQTLALETEPFEFEWNLTAIPEELSKYRSTAHIIFDSRKMDPWLLEDLEAILYGSEDNPPNLPPLRSIVSFIRKWDRLIITDHGDGTWSADTQREGIIEMLDETTFQITSETAIYLDPETYEVSSSEKNEEDIWPQ